MTTPPMAGTVPGRILAAAPVSIHGDRYFDVAFQPDGAAEAISIRVPSHLCRADPQPGRRARAEFLLGQVQRFDLDSDQT